MLVRTRVASNKSPWLADMKPGDIHTIAISHGEGRFVAPQALIDAARRKRPDRHPVRRPRRQPDHGASASTPTTPYCAIEGITSPDGRVFGKMGHTERYVDGLYKNVGGSCFQDLFGNAVRYFR